MIVTRFFWVKTWKKGKLEMKGEFEKRAYTKDDIESLIQSRWKDIFVDMTDVNMAREEFLNIRLNNKIYRDHLHRGNASRVELDIHTWFEKWFGNGSNQERPRKI